jgi:anti-sigma B factor antagonist
MLRRVTWESEFRTECCRTRSTTVLSVYGELDLSVAFRLGVQIDRAFARGSRTLVVDLAGVSFIDATGLRPLHRAAIGARESDRRLVLLRGAPCVDALIERCGLESHFEVLDRLEDLHVTAPLAAGV